MRLLLCVYSSCLRRRPLILVTLVWVGLITITYLCLRDESQTSDSFSDRVSAGLLDRRHHAQDAGPNHAEKTRPLHLSSSSKHDDIHEDVVIVQGNSSSHGLTLKQVRGGNQSPRKTLPKSSERREKAAAIEHGRPRGLAADRLVAEGQGEQEGDVEVEEEEGGGLVSSRGRMRSLEYCNLPQSEQNPEEGIVPVDYKLHSVHIVIRHGDRTSMYNLPNHSNPQLACRFDHTQAGAHQSLASSYQAAMDALSKTSRKGSNVSRFGLYPKNSKCVGAQLTGQGILQHLRNGDSLRKIYGENMGFLTESPDVRQIYVRSTDYQRTFQSGMALLYGLFPKMDFGQLNVDVTGRVNFCSEKLTGLSCDCPMAQKLHGVYKKEAAKRNITSGLLKRVKQETAGVLNTDSKHLPWVSAIVEVFMSYVCHRRQLPCNPRDSKHCVSWTLLGNMWNYLDIHGKADLSSYSHHKYNRLIMHPLLHEITRRMLNTTQGRDGRKLILYSGHDVTVSPLAKALGIHDGRWTPYASRVVFELYSNREQHYFIRVLYNGKDRTKDLRFCRQDELVDNLCPLDNFVYFVLYRDLQFFGKSNYGDACSLS